MFKLTVTVILPHLFSESRMFLFPPVLKEENVVIPQFLDKCVFLYFKVLKVQP